MEQYKVRFDSLPWQQPTAGVRFKAYEQDGQRLRLAEFTKEFVEADWCTKGHIGYVLEGELQVDFHGRVVTFHSGDGLFIPAGDEHGHKAKVLTASVTVVLVENV
jgi:quercetin dioxygenase-like cupin family protein